MSDLTTAEVQAMGAALELPMTPEDLVEVTHRLNAFLEELARAAHAYESATSWSRRPPDFP